MKIPRPILIRLFIYIPVIGFLGWQAVERWSRSRVPVPDMGLPGNVRTVQLPDGRSMQITEITEAEYEAAFGKPPPASEPPGAGDGAAPSAPPAAAPASTALH